jgi:DNA helicase-4
LEISSKESNNHINKEINNKYEIELKAIESVALRFNIKLPYIMTFHALAYAIVHPEENILYNDADGGAQGLSRVVQQIIDDHFKIPFFWEKFRTLMINHFREDLDSSILFDYNKTRDRFLDLKRSLPRESLGGEYVKSFGEKLIADFLFEHGIAYKYERNHWWGGLNYKPDFTIFKSPASGIVIEYFGLSGDTDYDEMSRQKVAYWKDKPDWSLLALYPKDIKNNDRTTFFGMLKNNLKEQGINCVKLSEDEIWHRIRDRAIDRFTTAVVGFIGRCRKKSISPSDLSDAIGSYSPTLSSESMFLDLVYDIYKAYLERLENTGEEDFDGLIQNAATLICQGKTTFKTRLLNGNTSALKHVFIDEFQDFSDLFYKIIKSIKKNNLGLKLFCVGDDWQAINSFAGSDIRFFEQFEYFFGKSRRLYISTNYRSLSSIVSIGNSLMCGAGNPAVPFAKEKGNIFLLDINNFEPTLIEKQRHEGDIITPCIIRLAHKYASNDCEIALLCRRKTIPWFVNFKNYNNYSKGLKLYLEHFRNFLPSNIKDKISISTAHGYKGLERSVIIILDAVARSYPLIHPDWIFYKILGDTPEKIIEEERRLLYVALTRAVNDLIIITDGRNKSPFIHGIEQNANLSKIDWSNYTPVRSQSQISRVAAKIGNQAHRGGSPTFLIKDLLKASQYKWQSTGWPGWTKTFPYGEFSIDNIKSEIWSKQADGIEVRIFDDEDNILAKYIINNGNWACLFNNIDK